MQSFDPGNRQGVEQRFCCPLPGCAGKSHSKAHRSLSVNTRTGDWHCHRCGSSGRLVECRDASPTPAYRPPVRTSSRDAARRAFNIAPDPRPVVRLTPPSATTPTPPPPPTQPARWRSRLIGIQPLENSPAEAYLRGREIDSVLARLSGVRYHPRWYGQAPAAVFPIRDQHGELVAAQGRFLSPTPGQPKMMTAGSSRLGVFATPDALRQAEIIITEAPIDALSLALCAFPALALIGTHYPEWLPTLCIGKRVLIATDADEPGNRAANDLAAALARRGTPAERLTPCGVKDWNEFLQRVGRVAMAKSLIDATGINR